jgi:hypothetical protein
MKGMLVSSAPDRRWPLHPRPSEWENLETWVRRIAETYGGSVTTRSSSMPWTTKGEGRAIWTRRLLTYSPDCQQVRESLSSDCWK